MRLLCSLAILLALAVAPVYGATITYFAHLVGSAESPPNGSPATGDAEIDLDLVAHTLLIDVTFSGLTTPTIASHIHCCTSTPLTGNVGVATQTPTFVGFPLGVTSGTYFHVFNTSLDATWNAPFESAHGGTALGAEAALAAGLANGTAYLNIHTSGFAGGEIRGFIVPTAVVPEPSSGALAAVAFLALCLARAARLNSSTQSSPA